MVAFLIFIFTTNAWCLLVRAVGLLDNTNATKLRVSDFAPPIWIAFDTAQRVFTLRFMIVSLLLSSLLLGSNTALPALTALPDEPFSAEPSEAVATVVSQTGSQSPDQMVVELNKLAAEGDDSALELLGELHLIGLLGVARDPRRGCDYFVRLEGRSPIGLHNLALCHETGDGAAQDLVRARMLYHEAAAAGFLQSFCAYGNMLIAGQGGEQQVEEGLRLCRMSAIAGDANAQTDYGIQLLIGKVTERDPVTARFMFEQAIVQEQHNAAYLLAQIYQKGDGVEASDEIALKWFEKAHQWGRPDAAFRIAQIHLRRGFSKDGDKTYIRKADLERAIEWYEIAATNDPNPDQRETARDMIENSRTLIEAAR